MKLKPCPCGETPEVLCITDNGQGGKWAMASCDKCGEWNIEFRTHYYSLDSDECYTLAVKGWDDAPRGKT